MGEYLRKFERSLAEMAEAAEAEVGNGGMIKMKAADDEEVSSFSSNSSKRRKVDGDSSPEAELVNLPTKSTASSSSDADMENMRSADLKQKDSERKICNFNISQFSETSASSELCGVESAEFMENSSSATKMNSHFKPSEVPSAAEIEDFFATAEKQVQKRFIEKYNYDILRDVPLEGRYEWIRLKP